MFIWFRKLFSKYSKKTVHLYQIFLYKFDIYLLNRRKNKYFKEIGRIFYNDLLNSKETDQIIENIQPILSVLEKIDKKIEKLNLEIEIIAKKEKISSKDVEKIEKFIEDTDKKIKKDIFEDFDDLDIESDLEFNIQRENPKEVNDIKELKENIFNKKSKKKSKEKKSKNKN